MVWMLLGNGALYLSVILIGARHAPLPSSLDATAVLAVLVMVLARYLDITRFAGKTVDGEPATMTDWRGYTIKVLCMAAAAWSLAHYIAGNFSG